MHRLIPAALFALSAAPALGEVAALSDTGFVIKHSAQASAGKSETWKVLTAPSRWWSGDHTYSGDAANLWLDAQATGCFCEKLPRPKGAPETQRIGSIEHMHVVYADPQAGVLRMTGGLGPLQQDSAGGTLTVTLSPAGTPAGEGTRIDWTYVVSGLVVLKPQEIAPLVDKVLGEQFERLAARSAAPAQSDDPATLRE